MIFRRQKPIPAEELTEVLLRKDPVWEFCNDDEAGETLMRPVKKLPISTGAGRLIGCELRLVDGSSIFGYLGNLSLTNKDRNQHFLTVSVFLAGSIEHLARYHDVDFSRRGPSWFAMRLGKKETDVFPLSYDLSWIAAGADDCVRGSIPKAPTRRLSESELIQLSVRQ